MTRKVKTIDLEPGDVVVFADQLDKVVSLELPEKGCVVTVHVKRTINGSYHGDQWFNAGDQSIQDVILSEEALAVMGYLLKTLSKCNHVHDKIVPGAYDAAVNHHGFAMAPEGRDIIAALVMEKLVESFKEEPDCEAEVY